MYLCILYLNSVNGKQMIKSIIKAVFPYHFTYDFSVIFRSAESQESTCPLVFTSTK